MAHLLAQQSCDLTAFAFLLMTAVRGVPSDGVGLQCDEHQVVFWFGFALFPGRSKIAIGEPDRFRSDGVSWCTSGVGSIYWGIGEEKAMAGRKALKRTASPEIDRRFQPVVDAFAEHRDVTTGKMTSSYGLKVNGKIFPMFGRKQFVTKAS
jgi:hypothetical protein